ncbi:ATP-binding protein [Micrococcus sp.]|uniref:ATP-binding protein n=1 Tax=Micrococcus sp. TaxID=1271 RepID=UPI002A90F71C|nr:SbcC/MukB-like Walker B domain-containing protein [Micrococcus sp.]MDY6054516.1 ATP-binding protein [Micrococcus sp.]
MSMEDTLFGLIPTASRGEQWTAERLQLVNWGGYDGAHRVRFSPGATLLCGGSGSGKSTLMDAYIALMMPHRTPFNGASNGGVTGRPRGEDQRNILSYGRGKTDETRTESGTRMSVLRGDGEDTWTAIAMTWQDHGGRRFTALRAWYIPADATLLEDTVKVRAVTDGPFDLACLEDAAQRRLSDAAVRALGLSTVPTDHEFWARVHATLGIGAAGAGEHAMDLLAKIQAGQPISTVDRLYKDFVLERPQTFATAAAVVEHFDELESTRRRMETAKQQVAMLQPVPGLRERIEQASDRLRLVAEVGTPTEAASPAGLWHAGRRLELLRALEDDLRARSRGSEATARRRWTELTAVRDEREGLEEVLRASGGDRLAHAEREYVQAERRAAAARQRRDAAAESLAVLRPDLSTREAFTALTERARAELEDTDGQERGLEDLMAARIGLRDAQAEESELRKEHAQVSALKDNIPPELHEARDQLARATGTDPAQLPFVGELVQVKTEYAPWRGAFNLALGGFATTVLLDEADLPRFRRAADEAGLGRRLQLEALPTGLPAEDALDAATLPGRLDYRPGPFTGALQEHLVRRFGYVCVASAEELDQHPRALTLRGQTAERTRGAVGGDLRRNVLGFSNRDRLAELERRLEVAHARVEEALEEAEHTRRLHTEDTGRRSAWQRVLDLDWGQIDVPGAEAEQQRWGGVIEEITQKDPRFGELRGKVAALREREQTLQREAVIAEEGGRALNAEWTRITEEVDAAQDVLDDAARSGRVLTAEQRAYLSARIDPAGAVDAGAVGAGGGGAVVGKEPVEADARAALERFDTALSLAASRLQEDREAAQAALEQNRQTLRRTLETFLERWPNPNLRADPDTSVGDFERILAELEADGLHELEGAWRENLLKLSGNDLTNLDSTLTRALREIRERIEPINTIMADLPFYDDDHRLRISARETQSASRQRFRRELRAVRSLIEQARTDAEREAAYTRMARLIERIRPEAPEAVELIDVRQHVRVSAEKIHADTGEHVALYDHIGEKSGGESQELVAFIVGAALRYQLGDADAARPRYAPVFLDEAMVKADAHFTERAIGAWRGLGFQLVIGAPNDKYSAIEPHVDVEYDILKDTTGRSHARLKVALPEG